MRRWLVLAAVMTTGLAQAQYGPQGTKVDAVLAMARQYGPAELIGSGDYWFIFGTVKAAGRTFDYEIDFEGCDAGTRFCQSMKLMPAGPDGPSTEEISLSWASLKGVSRDYLKAVFGKWANELPKR